MEVTTKTVKWDPTPSNFARLFRKIVGTVNGIYSIACDEETVEDRSFLFGVRLWDQNDFTWKKVSYSENQDETQIPPLAAGFSVVAHGKFIYIWGGGHNWSRYRIIGSNVALYQFDTEKNIWTKPKQKGYIPDNKYFHGAVVVDGRMIIFGGNQLGEKSEMDEMFSLDLDTFTWTFFEEFEHPDLPLHSIEASFVFENRFIYFFSKYVHSNIREKKFLKENLACFDLQEKKFVLTKIDQDNEASPDGSKLKNGFSYGGILYFFDNYYDRILLFNPRIGIWKKLDFVWKGAGHLDELVVTKDQITVFLNGNPTGEQNENDEENQFVHIFNFECNLQSMCIMTAIDYNLDISNLPNKIQKKINNSKRIKIY